MEEISRTAVSGTGADKIRGLIKHHNLYPLPDEIIYRLLQIGEGVDTRTVPQNHLVHSIRVMMAVEEFHREIKKLGIMEWVYPEDLQHKNTSALVHDIGKRGPAEYDFPIGENPFVKIYNYDIHAGALDVKLLDTLEELFEEQLITKSDKELVISETQKYTPSKHPEEIVMRDYYNIHPKNTHDNLVGFSLPEDIIRDATNHHLMRKIPGVPDASLDNEGTAINSVAIEIFDKLMAIMRRDSNGDLSASVKNAIQKVQTSIESYTPESTGEKHYPYHPVVGRIYTRFMNEAIKTGVLKDVVLEVCGR